MRRGSATFEAIIAGPHTRKVRVQVLRGANRSLGYADVSAASLSISGDSSTITRRTLDLTLAATDEAVSWFQQMSTTVRVQVGASSGSTTAWLPVHWGVSLQPNIDRDSGTIQVSSPDLAQRIADDSFVTPKASDPTLTVAQQASALLAESVPWVGFKDETGDSTLTASGVVWTDSRADAVAQLAQSIGAELFFSPVGNDGAPAWVLRPERTLRSLPDFQVTDRANLSSASESVDFTQVYNVMIAQAERADGSTLQGVSIDDDPASPLNVMDCGRRVSSPITSSLYTTQEQVDRAAYVARLRQNGYPASLDVTGALHPGIECGDLWLVRHNRKSSLIIPGSISYDLFSGAFSSTGRAATLPQAVGVPSS